MSDGPTVNYPGQCCRGYCVDDTLHDLTKDQADRVADVVAARTAALTADVADRTRERDFAREQREGLMQAVEKRDEWLDAARAELAAANARVAELEALVAEKNHALEKGAIYHDQVCAYSWENQRLRARLEQVQALAEKWENDHDDADDCETCWLLQELVAALAPVEEDNNG